MPAWRDSLPAETLSNAPQTCSRGSWGAKQRLVAVCGVSAATADGAATAAAVPSQLRNVHSAPEAFKRISSAWNAVNSL